MNIILKNNKVKEFFKSLVQYIGNHLIASCPSYKVRNYYYKHVLKIKMGSLVSISMNCFFSAYVDSVPNIEIGNNVVINRKCHLDGRVGIKIGNNVSISEGTYILTLSHDLNSPSFACKGESVIIDDYAWLGIRCTILPGVHVGKGAVIGANAVVTRDVPPYTVVAGIPAKPIGKRAKNHQYNLNWFPFFDS